MAQRTNGEVLVYTSRLLKDQQTFHDDTLNASLSLLGKP